MSQSIKNKKILSTSLFIVFVVLAALIYINNDKNKRIDSYLETKNDAIKVQYNTIYTNYKIACDNVYVSLLKNQKLMDQFKKAKDATDISKKIIRKNIYELLEDRYQRIKKFGVWQLHFHLPDNRSFLRMHKPTKFGDDLTDVRYSVDYVNKNKKAIEGFEVGRVIHGFRFVYPVIDQTTNEHLGSVEISMSSGIFKDTIEKSYRSHVDFILTKKIIRQKLWEDQIGDYYQKSEYSDDYLERIDNSPFTLVLDKSTKKEISENFKSNELFSVTVRKKDSSTGVLTFLPVKNIKDNEKVAYFVAYQDDEIVHRLDIDFYIINTIVVFIGLLLIVFLIKDENYKYKLEERIKEKTKSLEEKKTFIEKKFEEQTHILNTLNEAVIIYADETCVESNEVAIDMLGFSNKQELLGEKFLSFLNNSDKEVIPNKCLDGESITEEIYVIKKDGKKFPALLKYHAYCTDVKCMVIISIVDLSELKEKEKHLMQQSKLAQMGEMISMIAHQWRQPLAAISSTTNALILKVAMEKYEKEFFYDRLINVSDYSQHLSSTIDDFRNFFKTHKEIRDIELKTIVEDSLRIIETSMESNNINIIKNFKNDDKVATFPNELRQVVLNLLKNAEDALLEKDISEKWIKVETGKEGDKNYLIVKDNAGGIPNDILDKVFEPYFSTKTNKNGTGLGLYMSKTIIEDHCKGKLMVTNDELGAVFRIEI